MSGDLAHRNASPAMEESYLQAQFTKMKTERDTIIIRTPGERRTWQFETEGVGA